ncbi:MAG: F0F1 ATP synthase subunit delta [Proteobacteria bacterium]|nr:F0F1 ATP synthase subunit delta [Pseudomonadota bacterium]MBU1640611.1 F0F1 ATP synthase subunit delta [Pseudomonadota bacterium]
MKNAAIAKRYAKALLAVGKDENALDEYATSLNEFAALVAGNPELADALANPIYPLDAREGVMREIVKAAGVSTMMGNFLKLLVQKRRADVLGDIAEMFQNLVDQENNTCQGVVTSATEISADLQAKIQKTLEKITGKRVTVTNKVDASIIGGMIAKVGDLVMDGSIRTQLEDLKESIKGSE